MSKQYFIPRNYKDAGRVFGMFRMRHLIAALLWGVPVTFLFSILPLEALGFKAQLYLWAFLAGLPAGALLMGWGDLIALMMRFHRHKRIYYSREYKE